MALSFPPNPQPGDTYVAPNGYTYTWDGTKWYVSSSGQSAGGSGPFTVKDEGNIINTATTILNFVGNAITATSTGSQVNITVSAQELTTATTATLGGVKIGTGINIDGNGVISVREGLQYWTESQTVIDSSQTSIVSLLVVGTQTNIDAVVKPKGDGAIANDNGGNDRGAYAVDWQRVRGVANDVASGDYAVISGGSFNKATGLHSLVIGGNNNTNDGNYAVVLGGSNGNTRGVKGVVVTPGFATGGAGNSSGIIQSSLYVMGELTADTTQGILTTDGTGVLAADNQIVLTDNSVVYFKGTIVAKEVTNTSRIEMWNIEGAVRRDEGSTTTNYVYSPTVTPLTTVTHSILLDLDATIGCMFIRAFPAGGHNGNIRWAAKIETLEVANLGM